MPAQVKPRRRRPLIATALVLAVALGGAPVLAGTGRAVAAGSNAPGSNMPAAGAGHVAVSVAGPVTAGRPYDVTLSGYADQPARAYVFIDYGGCASLAAEEGRALDESRVYAVDGAFAQVSGWRSAVAGQDHACAYLVARRSGQVLARGAAAYRVS